MTSLARVIVHVADGLSKSAVLIEIGALLIEIGAVLIEIGAVLIEIGALLIEIGALLIEVLAEISSSRETLLQMSRSVSHERREMLNQRKQYS